MTFETDHLFFFVLVALIFLQLILAYSKSDPVSFWSPMTMISLVYSYYCVLGAADIFNGEPVLMYRGINHRSYISAGLIGAVVSYLGFWLGFVSLRRKLTEVVLVNPTEKDMTKYGLYVFLIAIALLIVMTGSGFISKLDFWDSAEANGAGLDTGSLTGYFIQSVIFFVAATCFTFIGFLKKNGQLIFIVVAFLALSLYINSGFRWRIVVLAYSLLSVYHLLLKKKLNFALVLSVLFPLLLLMGVMEVARNYGRGLDTSRLEGKQTEELLESSTTESATFLASSYIISEYDNYYEYSGLQFIYVAISMPIPRFLFLNKPDASYVGEPILGLYGGQNGFGQAVLCYAEYYMACGWFGVFFFPFLIGLYLKNVWNWFLQRRDSYLAIIRVSIISAMTYVLVSRGYFAQFLTLFLFATLPIGIVIKIYKKK